MPKLLIRIRRIITPLTEQDDGQGLTEYALMLALIALVAIVSLVFLGGSAQSELSTIASSIPVS